MKLKHYDSTLFLLSQSQPVHELEQLTVEIKGDIDVEYMKRAKDFLKRSTEAGKPFLPYFNYSPMHLPTIPRAEFKGKTGRGDWADSLLQMDTDFGTLLDYLKLLGVDDNTIVVFSGDSGPEELAPWRGTSGIGTGPTLSAWGAHCERPQWCATPAM